MSDQILSATYVCAPSDHRCRYWAKVVRAGTELPLPEHVDGASDVPGPYVRRGDDVELFEGDWLLEGEEVSHRKQRGWTYHLRALGRHADTDELGVYSWTFGVDSKPAIRAAGAKDLLGGSGDVAAMVREIHARRRGIKRMPRLTPKAVAEDVAETQ